MSASILKEQAEMQFQALAPLIPHPATTSRGLHHL